MTAVLSASEARRSLNTTLERFRCEGASATPMVFGSHRKPEAVVLPYARYQQLLIDMVDGVGVEIEFEGVLPSFTKPRAMGVSAVNLDQALRLAAELDSEQFELHRDDER